MPEGALRRPAVAGTFYPATRAGVAAQIEELWPAGEVALPRIAAVVPHAGWMYSGAVAARTLARTAIPERVVLLGVNHRGRGSPLASWSRGSWQTPLGRVPVDEDLVSAIARQAPGLVHDERAHDHEHSLEVEVPFLQAKGPAGLRLAPVSIATHELAALEELGRAVAAAVRASGQPCLILASTDLTHYEDAAAAEVKDRYAIERIRVLDGPGLLETVRRRGITMCGVAPTTAALVAARALGATGATLVQYTTSGEVTGDSTSVVGYAGFTVP